MANIKQEFDQKVVDALIANPDLINDKRWRMENLYYIITKSGTKEVFKMNRAQKHFFENYLVVPNPYYRHIILKSRQLGFTTFIQIFMLDEVLFKTNKEGIVIAHKLEDAKEFFDRKIDFAVRNIADDVKGAYFRINRNSARKIQISRDYGPEKGSMSSISVNTSGRSGTFHYVHISEYAKLCAQYPSRAAEVETGTFPAVPLDGYVFIESTAEGMSGRFYEIFHENWTFRQKITPDLSRVQFMPHFYNWQYDDMEMVKIGAPIPVDEMAESEIDWKQYKEEHNLTDIEITYYYMKWLQFGGKNSPEAIKKLKQEFPTTPEEAFMSTGQNYFPITKVTELLNVVKKGTKGEIIRNSDGKLEFIENFGGYFSMREAPRPGVRYIVSGDTSEGLAHGDAQVAYVTNCKTGKCAGVYRSQVPPDEFANVVYDIGMFYNIALVAVEVNKDGLWVNAELEKRGYQNLYYRKSFDDITKQITKMFGWKTTSATRPFALAALKAFFLKENDGFPPELLEEMLVFVRNTKGRPEAMAGKHDDVIMAASIGHAVLQENWQPLEDKKPDVPTVMSYMFGEASPDSIAVSQTPTYNNASGQSA